MSWNQIYKLKSALKSSLWLVPIIAIPLELLTIRIVHWLDDWLGLEFLGLDTTGAQTLLQTIVTASLSFVVFTFGSMLVAIQVASAQLTPRIIATTLLQDRVVKYTVGLFFFTLLFALGVQNRLGESVRDLSLTLASLLGILTFAAFFYLIDYAARLLRPVSILTRVADAGLSVIESVYPEPTLGPGIRERQLPKLGPPVRTIEHVGRSGIVLAADLTTLLAEAERLNGVIEFVPQVGDFAAEGEPLFRLYGGASLADQNVLFALVAFGSERTMEQDPTFAFRIVIDIALRALSPAINDPTTAVLAIDQLHYMLRSVGRQHLRTDEILDASNQLRLVFRTPNWEDFVNLACREIRFCGANNLQIARRMRAMIENLVQTLPTYRHSALQTELSLLDRSIERYFPEPEDLALARLPDSQGLGGYSGRSAG
jgi:uncharacterized membrane protein